MRFFRRRDPRVRDELQFHRDRMVADFVAAGMSRADAERRAVREFGNAAAIEEGVRDVRGRLADDAGKDLRYALRMLRRSPGFSTVAILSLALGIGANTAIFSLINAVMLQTLPVPEPDRLVQLTRLTPSGAPGVVSYPLFERFRDNVRSVTGAFAHRTREQAIAIDGEEEFVTADFVTGDYFAVLRLQPAAGRVLTPDDEQPAAAAPGVMISDGYWERRFARSPSAIGRSVVIGRRVFSIAGVTPAAFRGVRTGSAPDLTIPLLQLLDAAERQEGDLNSFNVIARLAPGATLARADAEVRLTYAPFVEAQAARVPERDRDRVRQQRAGVVAAPDGINPYRDAIGRPLLILMGIVALILLLACVNLSGLLLARGEARQRELSIRLAIGAGRGRLVRQLLTESLLLAVAGAASGLALAVWLSERLFALFTTGRTVALAVSLDWRVLAFTAAVSIVASVCAGLVPAWHAVRTSVQPALKEVRARGHRRLGRALVAAQLAISMVLVVGSTLFIATLVELHAVDRGFDGRDLLVVTVRSGQPYPPPRAAQVHSALLEGLAALPDARAASAAQVLPAAGSLWTRRVQVEGYTFGADEPDGVAFNAVAPGYFAALGTAVLAGREFDRRDHAGAPKVAIVNASFARYFFGDRSALGRRVSNVGITYEIVGVVRDARYESLRQANPSTMYIATTQRAEQTPASNYLVRAAYGDPMRLAPGLERVIRAVDPGLRLRDARPYTTIINREIAAERVLALIGGVFGLLAMVIAALGVFGVLAFQVARRTNELGVRMALGATRRSMIRLVLADVGWMVGTGIVMGAGAAVMLTGFAERLLFGVTPRDPAAFAAAAGLLTLAALLAGWLPARRAAGVDPVVALRHE